MSLCCFSKFSVLIALSKLPMSLVFAQLFLERGCTLTLARDTYPRVILSFDQVYCFSLCMFQCATVFKVCFNLVFYLRNWFLCSLPVANDVL